MPVNNLSASSVASLPSQSDRQPVSATILVVLSIAALPAFAWPFLSPVLQLSADAAPIIAVAAAVIIAVGALFAMNRSLRSATTIALLAALTALGMVIRFLGLGFGGVEPVFALFVVSGFVLGARFGFMLGAFVMLTSSLLWGGVGPWLPFQMFAAAWVGAGAGWLPKPSRTWVSTLVLTGYGVLCAYVFGLLMNLWWWPFAVGLETSLSFEVNAGVFTNVTRFVTYSLVSSTLTWDTVRAITTAAALLVFSRPAVAALRRVS